MTYISDPLSRNQLRGYARAIREQLEQDGFELGIYFPVIRFLETFHKLIDDESFHFEVVPNDYFSINIHAEYDFDENCVRLKESVYESAEKGNGRDRMTVMHELSHALLLKVSGIKLRRTMGSVVRYRDPEWHAKCLAGEIMVPAHLVKCMSAEEITNCCGVSQLAAETQLRSINFPTAEAAEDSPKEFPQKGEELDPKQLK